MKPHPERIAKGLWWDRPLKLVEGCTCGKTPHVCPVCCGKGTVLNTLYEDLDVSSVICNVTCRSCGGTGIVWG